MGSPNLSTKEDFGSSFSFGGLPSTPQHMNCIVEEDHAKDGLAEEMEREPSKTPQRPLSFYSNADGNNSSNSLIMNPAFSFGASATQENKRHSMKYVPTPKLPPSSSSRTKSPARGNRSPSPDRGKRRGSLVLDKPFNFSSSTLQPPASAGSATRASFRKGHRYKHSSVSMNFFQEPEVQVPLNIAKAMPIPDFADLKSNIPWPHGYAQLAIAALQIIACLVTFRLGHVKSWNNFITLSHFVLYDVIGSLAIILVENLSQFQVWNTGTITFPFGLNRMDVLLSFALAISLCFMGLDLFFHILEETIVLFVESTNDSNQHNDIAPKIPHSHHSSAFLHTASETQIWYWTLLPNLALSLLSLFKTYHSNAHTKFKTKNPVITCTYILYLSLYPLIQKVVSSSDYIATSLLSIFIMSYGWTIAKWTSTILLMGFSTASLNGLILDDDPSLSDDRPTKALLVRSKSTLPIAVANNNSSKPNKNNSKICDSTHVKSKIMESVQELPLFRANCKLANEDLVIVKVNFDQYIVLIRLRMAGGSNDDELNLRLAIDKCIRKILKTVDTTIDIDRL
ncbi:Zn(2+) transporter ZRG17 [Lachancea thermotolerans CBS 6340]|uniref:KLTH0A07128p n=1 Tax=Lachancea thermotolerans (strain ATCC 56472 / CBS 6340 / NRRL Y-8284) TaxID=559295 RepID=C5DC19_LACTC|nr:KLTH0A07128p [Lachancea thermotolerans CBS 6340]CAR21326.1 KLTH0A07128p [Lachancea thermotolerans CBS 6340]